MTIVFPIIALRPRTYDTFIKLMMINSSIAVHSCTPGHLLTFAAVGLIPEEAVNNSLSANRSALSVYVKPLCHSIPSIFFITSSLICGLLKRSTTSGSVLYAMADICIFSLPIFNLLINSVMKRLFLAQLAEPILSEESIMKAKSVGMHSISRSKTCIRFYIRNTFIFYKFLSKFLSPSPSPSPH